MDEPSVPTVTRPPDRSLPARPDSLRWTAAPVSGFVYVWLLAAATAAVFLAAGPPQGSLGVFLVAAGGVLTFVPPRVRLGWPLWAAVGGLFVCGSLAFLPAGWSSLPAWRVALAAAPAIHLPSTITPMPWETSFWLEVLGASCLTALYLLSHPIRSKTALGVAAAAVVVCGVYAGLSIYAKQTGWLYPFAGGATFGFFPNRNHTATFLVTGSIVAVGVLTISLRESRWMLSLLVGTCLAACMAGLFFYSGSRGGIVFLAVGIAVWAGGLGPEHRNVPLNVSLVVLAVAAGLLFLLSGGEARSRMLGRSGTGAPAQADLAGPRPGVLDDAPTEGDHESPPDFRALIYRDTFDLIKDTPLTGTGLGTFAPVFAQYRRASLTGAYVLHPESDWLMLAAEAGLPTVFFLLAALGLGLARLRGARLHPYWPLRWGCVSAAMAAALHGTVDVPAHRVALGWWILLLAGLGASVGRSASEKTRWLEKSLFIAGGLGTLTLGVQLIRAEWFGGRALPPFVATAAEEEILSLAKRGDHWAAMEKAREAVKTSPLAAPLYYQLGLALLHFEDSDQEVDGAFKAQRTLNPTWPGVPLLQGYAWAAIDPDRTVVLWKDALDRASRADHAPGNAVNYYRDLLGRSRDWPAVQRGLATEADRGPDFLLAWLDAVPADLARAQWPEWLARDTLLERLSAVQREKFLLLWYAKGERGELEHFLAAHAAWQPSAWPVRLREQVDAERLESAVHMAAEHYGVSLALPAASDLGDERLATFNREWTSGDTVSARRLLDEPDKLPAPGQATQEYWRLKSALAVSDRDWPHAWECLRIYVQQTRPEGPPL